MPDPLAGLLILAACGVLIAAAGHAWQWATSAPDAPPRGLLARLRRAATTKHQSVTTWCAHCRQRPRVLLPDGDERYCSVECQQWDADSQAHGL